MKHYVEVRLTEVTDDESTYSLIGAKFGSRLEPDYGFCIAFMVDGETLLVGDSTKEGYARTRAHKPVRSQALEKGIGSKVFNTKAKFGGKSREISSF
ncbi:hypothetical protein COLO4_16873 [Corchorus olitorius]|uniref:Uncharacterized protein n=1 Tax=Corchorus olitorius TaxID=93759 RepID=A0A1R3JF67_9ROSI|nr:hypothetical protein COLO4_16873 [Corchorus olitorius]